MIEKETRVMRFGETLADIDPLIAGRWSSRAIDPEIPVEREVVFRLLEAARWAPSSFNNQSWRYIVLTQDDSEALEKGRDALVPGNAWATVAPVLFYVLGKKHFAGKSTENWRRLYEAGLSAITMAYQAVREGLVFHQMAGYSIDKVRAHFSVPEEYDIIAAIAVGYPGENPKLTGSKLEMETEKRERLSHEELFSWNGWNIRES